ncbi:MAG: hypothetical protein M3R63_10970 [Actinomycetota bacterium]|nr:hypothetical protein [Actinomycetota bacterium]
MGGHLYCQNRFTADGEVNLVAARVGAEDVMTVLRRSVVQLSLTGVAGRGLLREAVDALTARGQRAGRRGRSPHRRVAASLGCCRRGGARRGRRRHPDGYRSG